MRLFTQPILSAITGNAIAARPIDTMGADILQSFAKIGVGVAERSRLRLSAGRKPISLGAGGFIDTRYGPNGSRPSTAAMPLWTVGTGHGTVRPANDRRHRSLVPLRAGNRR